MHLIRRHLKRVITDLVGYILILLGILLGWLPGPGGIPLILAGLGLLSINNKWAEELRKLVLKHSGRFLKLLFPKTIIAQFLYDVLVLLLLVIVGILEWQHEAAWQIGLGITCFFIALFVALMNRERYMQLRRK